MRFRSEDESKGGDGTVTSEHTPTANREAPGERGVEVETIVDEISI